MSTRCVGLVMEGWGRTQVHGSGPALQPLGGKLKRDLLLMDHVPYGALGA